MPEQVVIEGTWEEIVAHADELAGRKVRLTVLDTQTPPLSPAAATREYRANPMFEPTEISAPFDIPRPGPGVLVRSQPGGSRLPDIPAAWLEEE